MTKQPRATRCHGSALPNLALHVFAVTAAAVLTAVVACSGPEHAAVVDAADVAASDTDTNPPTDTAVLGDIQKPVPCGVQPSGDYWGPCDLELAPDRRSTLCDEAAGVCVAPEARCADGWCYVPPRSYLSGFGADRIGTWAMDAAITVVPRAFLIQEIEFTLGEFVAVMGYEPAQTGACGATCPVAGVTLFEAMEVANRKSDADGLQRCYVLAGCGFEDLPIRWGGTHHTWTCQRSTFAGPSCTGYRLPSRAEWELAAGGGSPYCLPVGPTDPYTGDHECTTNSEVAEWSISCANADFGYRPCAGTRTYTTVAGATVDVCLELGPARSTLPNAFGLYEVFGNVAEYTQTLLELADLKTDPRSDGPYALASGPEFTSQLAHDDIVAQMGGHSTFMPEAVCRWRLDWVGLTGGNLFQQGQGFRLVRTVPTEGATP